MQANETFACCIMKRKSFFITFEGIDGSGKSTQLRLTKNYLKKLGYRIEVLREPGSTVLSEKIRKILLDKKIVINPASELMLYIAARAELVENTIAPKLAEGKLILCDRFYDSTTAYQGYGRRIDISLIEKMNNLAVGKFHPDLTFVIDIDCAASVKRMKNINKVTDRLESESAAFFKRVRKGFLEIARRNKKRIVLLDGRKPIQIIFQEIQDSLIKRLKIG